MRYTLVLLIFLFTSLSFAQQKRYNQFSLEVSSGLELPILVGNNFTDVSYVNFRQFQVSGRYMLDRVYGIKVHYGFNQFVRWRGDKINHHRYNFNRFGAEGVLNLTQSIFTFYRTRDFFAIILHAGPAVTLVERQRDYARGMHYNFMGGITANFRMSPRLSLFLDATGVASFYQQKSDAQEDVKGFGNVSVGLQYNIGRFEWHADWH